MRTVLMLALPVLLAVGRRLCLGDRRPLPGYRERLSAPGARSRSPRTRPAGSSTVDVADNGFVTEGDVLFLVDPEPYRIALAQADAALAAARLNVEQLRAAYSQALAQQQAAADDVAYLRSATRRARTTLAAQGHQRPRLRSTMRATICAPGATSSWRPPTRRSPARSPALGGDPDIATDEHPAVHGGARRARQGRLRPRADHRDARRPTASSIRPPRSSPASS